MGEWYWLGIADWTSALHRIRVSKRNYSEYMSTALARITRLGVPANKFRSISELSTSAIMDIFQFLFVIWEESWGWKTAESDEKRNAKIILRSAIFLSLPIHSRAAQSPVSFASSSSATFCRPPTSWSSPLVPARSSTPSRRCWTASKNAEVSRSTRPTTSGLAVWAPRAALPQSGRLPRRRDQLRRSPKSSLYVYLPLPLVSFSCRVAPPRVCSPQRTSHLIALVLRYLQCAFTQSGVGGGEGGSTFVGAGPPASLLGFFYSPCCEKQ